MSKSPLSYEELKLREAEMLAFLNGVPTPPDAPIIFAHTLLEELTALEKTVNKLKAFINFLSKLNPMQYIQWMRNAYAHYTAPMQPLNVETAESEYESSAEPFIAILPVTPKKTRKKKKATLTPA